MTDVGVWSIKGTLHYRVPAGPLRASGEVQRARLAEVELAVADSAQEGGPLRWREPEHAAVAILGVADADLAVRQVRDLNAVAVTE